MCEAKLSSLKLKTENFSCAQVRYHIPMAEHCLFLKQIKHKNMSCIFHFSHNGTNSYLLINESDSNREFFVFVPKLSSLQLKITTWICLPLHIVFCRQNIN